MGIIYLDRELNKGFLRKLNKPTQEEIKKNKENLNRINIWAKEHNFIITKNGCSIEINELYI